jgi:hypothetical protein
MDKLGKTPDSFLSALKRLEKDRQPHGDGGFSVEDVLLEMRDVFRPRTQVVAEIEELIDLCLIAFCGFDDTGEKNCYRST